MVGEIAEYFQAAFFNAANLMFWAWALCYLAGLTALYLWTRWSRWSWRDFLEYSFPARIYGSASFRDDLKIILAYALVATFVVAGRASLQSVLILQLGTVVAESIGPAVNWFNIQAAANNGLSSLVILALAHDFGNFLGHYSMHRVDFLWRFHKVHHSAAYLAPTTQFRSHPVEPLTREFFTGLIVGPVAGVLVALNWATPENLAFDKVWMVSMIYYISAHFRHSHQWISFGPYLSYLFNSPAMHQIHHSIEPRHLNKNMATIFSLWDWAFGTLYIPRQKEQFRIGLDDPEEQRRFVGLWNLFFIPFKGTDNLFVRRRVTKPTTQ